MTLRVRLRDVHADDLPFFFKNQRDPNAGRLAAVPSRDRDAFMDHWARLLADDAITKKTVLVGERVAGNVLAFGRDGRREIGYWIDREYWGRGVATKALAEFLAHVRERPLHAHVAKHNPASVRVLEKCGFAVVGEDKAFAQIGGEVIEGVVLELP